MPMTSTLPASPPARDGARANYDFYGPIHKGLRFALVGLLVRLGQLDPSDQVALEELIRDLRLQLALSAEHLAHEDEHVHPALESRAPGSTARLAVEHVEHQRSFADLERAIVALEIAPSDSRREKARALYLAFSAFVASDLAHMHREEAEIQPLLQSLYSDAEIGALEQALVASLPPHSVMAYMRIILPALDRVARAELLRQMRAGAPAEAFQAVLDQAARPTLSREAWADLSRRLALAA